MDDATQRCAKRKREGDNFIYSGGELTEKEKQKVVNVKVVDFITKIPHYAFHYCASLTTIDISSSSTLSKIQSSAFEGCASLISITLPNLLTVIEERAFKNCNHLSTVSFPNNSQCKEIRNQAFSNCKSLTSINLPDSIEIVGEDVRFILFFFCRFVIFGDDCLRCNMMAFTHSPFSNISFCRGKKYKGILRLY